MLRRINLFLRGRLFSGSNRRWWAGVAEASFAGFIFFLGVILFVASLTVAVIYGSPNGFFVSGYQLILQIVLALSLVCLGTYWIARLIWDFGVSADRRGALATRASELELVQDFRKPRTKLPAIPAERLPPRPGRKLKFRLQPSPRNVWGLLTSAAFSIVLTSTFTILLIIVINALQNRTSQWETGIQQSIGPSRLSSLPDVPWIAAVLSLPILAAAFWSIYLFIRQLLKLTGIGPTGLEVSAYPFQVGECYRFGISQTGRVRLKLLDVSLVCHEIATYDEGTDIRTENREVFSKRLFRRRGIMLRRGQAFYSEFQMQIPAGAMHSFKSSNNRIQWKIIVVAQAKNWPRLNRNFTVLVHPADETYQGTGNHVANPSLKSGPSRNSTNPVGF
ncbi:MAG: hypothetical protein AAF939_12160 [Planctomycetota bacterium]